AGEAQTEGGVTGQLGNEGEDARTLSTRRCGRGQIEIVALERKRIAGGGRDLPTISGGGIFGQANDKLIAETQGYFPALVGGRDFDARHEGPHSLVGQVYLSRATRAKNEGVKFPTPSRKTREGWGIQHNHHT